jgi:hypothetical protein
MKTPKKTSKWRTLRCVVEYRTPDAGMSERDLARDVQYALDHCAADTFTRFPDSAVWAKAFSAVMSRRAEGRPKKLATAIKAADALTKRLRAL